MDVIREFVREIQDDRLVKISVGDKKVPRFTVQQKLLKKASSWFLTPLEKFKGGQDAALNFPEDDVDAWNIFIYWMFHRKMLSFGDDETVNIKLVKVWIIADEYFAHEFQDFVMLGLLKRAESNEPNQNFSLSFIREAFKATQELGDGSKIRELLLEEAILVFFGHRSKICSDQEFENLDGIGIW